MKVYPPEIAVTLQQLMQWEYYVMVKEILPRRRVHSILAGKHAAKMRGRGLDFEEVRNYVAGDDIRNIDWKVTARTKKTHTKVFVEEKERPSFAIVDQTNRMFFGSEKFTKSVMATHAAALHAFRTIKMGDRFGGIVFNNDTSQFIQPKRSRATIQQFLKMVVQMNNELPEKEIVITNTIRINEVLHRASKFITHDFVLSIISDFSNADSTTFKHLTNLSKHNDIILINISDALENTLPNEKLLLSNGIKQISINKQSHTNSINAYRQNINNTLNDFVKKHRIVLININTSQPFEEQVKEAFR